MAVPSRRHVVCLGDSITRGQVSVDYVRMLGDDPRHSEFSITNAGVNGDLAVNALERLEELLALRPDVVTVLIGTNDANASLSEKNIRMMTRMKKLATRPTLASYRANLGAIVERLTHQTTPGSRCCHFR